MVFDSIQMVFDSIQMVFDSIQMVSKYIPMVSQSFRIFIKGSETSKRGIPNRYFLESKNDKKAQYVL